MIQRPTMMEHNNNHRYHWRSKKNKCHVSTRARRWSHHRPERRRFGAPRNTTSFIIRAKRSGGIVVSPCPLTPAVLPTPEFSPAREVLVDAAREEWGVDGYGSMNGLIRLRSLGYEEEGGGEIGGWGYNDVEEHEEMERKLDHDLSRFEMIYPSSGDEHSGIMYEHRFDDQDSHIAQLEEENFDMRERLFMMEKELKDLRWRVQCLENDGASKNESEDDDICSANGCVNCD